jgi:hypothetical protein
MTAPTAGEGEPHEPVLRLRNEFASIEVSVDRSANGDRLWLRCHPADVQVLLDPLQLEAIARLPESSLKEILSSIQVDDVIERHQEGLQE